MKCYIARMTPVIELLEFIHVHAWRLIGGFSERF